MKEEWGQKGLRLQEKEIKDRKKERQEERQDDGQI